MRSRVLPWAVAAATVIAMAGVQAQALTDPTRPPSAGAGPSPGGEQEAAPASRLQSVLISSGRKLAVIDGMTVPLGGMVGEARLVRITETEVLLRTGKETEVLKLFPGIDKQPSGRGLARARLGSPGTKPPRNGESR